MTTLFQVTIKPEVNGTSLSAKTFSSQNSYEHCYEKISKYLKTVSNTEDKVIYEVLHVSSLTFKD